MKRFIAFFLISLLPVIGAAGCAQAPETDAGKISIVCTIFPQYDWVRQILGDKADDFELTLLLDSRIDLHNFQPSVDDIVTISTADLFIFVGGESDEWVEDVLDRAINEDIIIINLLEELGDAAKEEELLEGMEEDGHDHEDEDENGHDEDEHDDDEDEDEHEDEHAEEDEDGHAHDDEREYDEHVWLSLRNAQVFCSVIADALTTLDAGNSDTYQSNLTAYIQKLSDLDADYQAAVDASPVKTLLFADRFPFRYLMDDYELTPYAAFSGCSAETEAGFETIVFLANKVDELNLKSIMVTESSDKSIAQTVISNTESKDQQILVLDAIQSVSGDDVQNGATYISIMQGNLDVLKEGLRTGD